jgi:endonuclease-3
MLFSHCLVSFTLSRYYLLHQEAYSPTKRSKNHLINMPGNSPQSVAALMLYARSRMDHNTGDKDAPPSNVKPDAVHSAEPNILSETGKGDEGVIDPNYDGTKSLSMLSPIPRRSARRRKETFSSSTIATATSAANMVKKESDNEHRNLSQVQPKASHKSKNKRPLQAVPSEPRSNKPSKKARTDAVKGRVKQEVTTVAVKVKKVAKPKTARLKKEKVKKQKATTTLPTGTNLKEVQAELRRACAGLALLHPDVVDRNEGRRREMLQSCGFRSSITDSIVSTMLSQNTTDANSRSAYKSLKKAFPTWESVLTSSSSGSVNGDGDDVDKLAAAIRVAGLAKTRAERIRAMLKTVKEERGEPSLEYVRDMSDDAVKVELGRFKGLGPKTISCVLLFGLGRNTEFPVDTHVLRITKQMEWIPCHVTTREGAYEYLNQVVPNDIKLDFHCLLVTHGKHCHRCAANGKPQFPPKDGTRLDCPLVKRLLTSPSNKKDSKMCTVKKEENPVSIKAETIEVQKDAPLTPSAWSRKVIKSEATIVETCGAEGTHQTVRVKLESEK